MELNKMDYIHLFKSMIFVFRNYGIELDGKYEFLDIDLLEKYDLDVSDMSSSIEKIYQILTIDTKYWIVDLQDYRDFKEVTLDEAKEHLRDFWNDDDYESDEEMIEHNERIERADADELDELLGGVDWILFKTKDDFEGFISAVQVKID